MRGPPGRGLARNVRIGPHAPAFGLNLCIVEKPTDGVLRIGWFASGSHGKDMAIIKRALEWASRQDGVEVWTMGLDPQKAWADEKGRPFRRTHVPWTNDLATYRKMMGVLDIGLAPVTPTVWSLGRSDLKALEYAAAGAVPVMSDISIYDPWLNGFGCIKAGTPKDWLNKIKYLVQNRADVKVLQAQAKEYVLGKRTNRHVVADYETAFA